MTTLQRSAMSSSRAICIKLNIPEYAKKDLTTSQRRDIIIVYRKKVITSLNLFAAIGMLHFLPNLFFFAAQTTKQIFIDPYIHWVFYRYSLYTKCYTSVTFLGRIAIKFFTPGKSKQGGNPWRKNTKITSHSRVPLDICTSQ